MAETIQDKQGRGSYGSYPSDDLQVHLLVLSLIMWAWRLGSAASVT